MSKKNVLVTGATGYIGGRLVPELLEQGHNVRCLARTPAKLEGLPWSKQVEIVKGDLDDDESLRKAMVGMDSAFYLVHSMISTTSSKFASRDNELADKFGKIAKESNLERIVFLGGLGDDSDPNLSNHLKSRHATGKHLRSSGVPVVELRAAVIIGSGSASFEMLRNLVEVLPAMVTPHWVNTMCQPIAIRDVLFYLQASLDIEASDSPIIEIGGPQQLPYIEMMRTYARLAHLRKRLIVKVPFLTPRLSSHWIGLVTPLPTSLAKPLVKGLSSEVIVKDNRAKVLMPHQCIDFVKSIELAIEKTRDLEVTTSWADADLAWRSPADPIPTDPEWSGGTVLEDTKEGTTLATPHAVYRAVTGIGGARGWLVTDKLWEIRGVIDKLVGGVGMRRGRRNPNDLRIGDALDFWRVEALVPDTLLRLRAEMRLPGKAWLEWNISSDEDGKTKLVQRARYQPRGLAGRLYWYSLLPFHAIIFKGLVAQLIGLAEDFDKNSAESKSTAS